MNKTIDTVQHAKMDALRPLLNTLPGAHFEGVLTMDTPEWRAELDIDTYVDDDDVEHAVSLVFQLAVAPDGRLSPTLSLDHWVEEVGVNDTQPFPFNTPAHWASLLAQWATDWELPESALQEASPFLIRLAAVADALSPD